MTDGKHIKLIACDVDGTLVCGNRVVSPELKEVFAELRRRGVASTLCTGRMPHWTVDVADELGITEFLICTEGGHVWHRRTGAKLHYAALSENVIEKAARAAEKNPDLSLAAIGDDVIWADREVAARRAFWWGHRAQLIGDIREAPPPVLLVLFGPHHAANAAQHALREALSSGESLIHDVEDQGSYAHFKICSPEADKGVGADRLVSHLGGDRTHVLAFGDYLNDLGIMRYAGQSICPRNAHPLIRQTATRTSPHLAEEGFVAREIRRIFGL